MDKLTPVVEVRQMGVQGSKYLAGLCKHDAARDGRKASRISIPTHRVAKAALAAAMVRRVIPG